VLLLLPLLLLLLLLLLMMMMMLCAAAAAAADDDADDVTGEFTPESKMMMKIEREKVRARTDPWKVHVVDSS